MQKNRLLGLLVGSQHRQGETTRPALACPLPSGLLLFSGSQYTQRETIRPAPAGLPPLGYLLPSGQGETVRYSLSTSRMPLQMSSYCRQPVQVGKSQTSMLCAPATIRGVLATLAKKRSSPTTMHSWPFGKTQCNCEDLS